MKLPFLFLIAFFSILPPLHSMEKNSDLTPHSPRTTHLRREGSSITRAVRSVWRKEREAKALPICEKTLDIKPFLRTKKDHVKALEEVFKNAQERIIIATPSISKKFVEKSFLKLMATVNKDIPIIFYTSLKASILMEEFLLHHQDAKAPVLMTMNNCGVYSLIMDSVLFTTGACSYLALDMFYQQHTVYMTSVIQGNEAKIPIDLCLYDLNKAMQKERDDSLISALEIKPQEVAEAPIPRPLLFDSTQYKENLEWLEKKN